MARVHADNLRWVSSLISWYLEICYNKKGKRTMIPHWMLSKLLHRIQICNFRNHITLFFKLSANCVYVLMLNNNSSDCHECVLKERSDNFGN